MPTALPIRTHLRIDTKLCGRAVRLEHGSSEVELVLSCAMAADPTGLVHGGFIFGAADHAAMLAVNEPFVVLAGARSRFLRPSRVGETLLLRATTVRTEGRCSGVEVVCTNQQGHKTFEGSFECVTLARHVLDS